MIRIALVGIFEMPGKQPLMLLGEDAPSQRCLPISIGYDEAIAIMCVIQGVKRLRPLTHDLLKNVLDELGARVDRIVITELREGVFYAELEVLQRGSCHHISSRPSDAIALAVRYDEPLPIFVEKDILEEGGVVFEANHEEEGEEVKRFREFLEEVHPEDFES